MSCCLYWVLLEERLSLVLTIEYAVYNYAIFLSNDFLAFTIEPYLQTSSLNHL